MHNKGHTGPRECVQEYTRVSDLPQDSDQPLKLRNDPFKLSGRDHSKLEVHPVLSLQLQNNMKGFFLVILAQLAVALPTQLDGTGPAFISALEIRQSCAASCGSSICYYSATVDEAVSAGCQRYQNDNPVNSYPHQFNNYGKSEPVHYDTRLTNCRRLHARCFWAIPRVSNLEKLQKQPIRWRQSWSGQGSLQFSVPTRWRYHP